MPRQCSAPLCTIDDSGGFFRLFPFPLNIEICSKWQAQMEKSTTTITGNVNSGNEIYLCEVHFGELCWDRSDVGEETLKETAVPSIFQHLTPVEYVQKLYSKLKSVNLCPAIGEYGMQVIEKLKPEEILEDNCVKKELIEFSNHFAVSAMQNIRIHLTSAAITSTEMENVLLAHEIKQRLLDVRVFDRKQEDNMLTQAGNIIHSGGEKESIEFIE